MIWTKKSDRVDSRDPVEGGANPGQRDNGGKTAREWALSAGRTEAAKVLEDFQRGRK